VIALIEALGMNGSALDIALPQLSTSAGDEIVDTLLRLEPLIEVLVAREHDVDAVRDE
jgi:hypothetical protein